MRAPVVSRETSRAHNEWPELRRHSWRADASGGMLNVSPSRLMCLPYSPCVHVVGWRCFRAPLARRVREHMFHGKQRAGGHVFSGVRSCRRTSTARQLFHGGWVSVRAAGEFHAKRVEPYPLGEEVRRFNDSRLNECPTGLFYHRRYLRFRYALISLLHTARVSREASMRVGDTRSRDGATRAPLLVAVSTAVHNR